MQTEGRFLAQEWRREIGSLRNEFDLSNFISNELFPVKQSRLLLFVYFGVKEIFIILGWFM